MNPSTNPSRRRRRIIPWLVFLAILALALFFHRCSKSEKPVSIPEPPKDSVAVVHSASRETTVVMPPVRDIGRGGLRSAPTVAQTVPVPIDTLPYVFPNPWGGRHFDSVTVGLYCREDCLILYSLEDSVNLRSYERPFTFRRTTTLWYAGVSARGMRTPVMRLDYVIEKNPGDCKGNSMPVSLHGHDVCVDVYEWPNRENAQPRAMVSQHEADDSCRTVGKHLCSLDEWQAACRGPDQSRYPYGNDYDVRYCPAQQGGPSRSGRFPACRSYYGVYDLTGNLWEWTSTVNPSHDDFYQVAGGSWDGADNAVCGMSKYSFYPQNSYASVGFRCCAEAK